MDLIVHQMVQLQEVHIAHGDLVVEPLAGTAVVQPALALGIEASLGQRRGDVLIGSAVEDGGGHLPAKGLGGIAQMDLQHLTDVHTGGNAQGVQHDIQRGAVGQEGHILLGQHAGHDALVAVTAGHLVAGLDLAALGDVDANHLIHAGPQLVAVLAGKDLGIDDDAALAVRHLQRGVADLAGLLAEDGAQQALLGGEVGLALGRDLTHQNVAGMNLGAHADDAALVQILQRLLAHVGDIAGDLLGPQLGVAGVDLVFLNMDGRVHVLLHQPLVEQHGVLVVVALPRHEAHQNVAAQCDLALIGGGTVRQHGGIVAAVDALAHRDDGLLVDAGAVVGAQELDELIVLGLAAVIADGHAGSVHLGHHAVTLGQHGHLGVQADLVLHAGAHDGRLRSQQRHGLTLHVGAHQGAVGVVVGQEGDHGRSDGHHHAGRYVDVVHAVAGHLHDLVAVTAGDTLAGQAPVLVHRLRRLTHHILILHIGGHVGDVIGDLARLVIHSAVRCLDEAVLVDTGISGQIGDQADVGAFRGLDGAHTAIVAVMHVSNLHVGALTAQTAGAQCGQTALVGQLGQRVGLIHELAQGAGAEELLDGGGDRPDVDEALGRHHVQILNGHALADHALHAAEADAELVLQQLAHAAQTAVAQMVDVVLVHKAAGQRVHIVDGCKDIIHDDVLGYQLVGVQTALGDQLLTAVLTQQLLQHVEADTLLDAALLLGVEVHIAGHIAHLVGEDLQRLAGLQRHGDLVHAHGVQLGAVGGSQHMTVLEDDLAGGGVRHGHRQLLALGAGPDGQLLIELVPAHHGQVVAAGIEEQTLQQRFRGIHRGGLAGAQLAVDLQQRLLVGLAGVLLQRGHDAAVIAETLQDLAVGLEAQRTDQAGDGQLAVLVDADPEHLAGVGLVLQPRAAVGDDGAGQQGQIGLQVDLLAVVHAGGADDLADHHALGAVDDKGAAVGHQREISHEDLLLLDLAGLLVVQTYPHLHGSGIRGVTRLALLHVILGFLVHAVINEAQLQITGIVRDRSHIGKYLPQAGLQEPLVGSLLDLQQVGHRHDLFVAGKILAQGLAVVLVFSHSTITPFSLLLLFRPRPASPKPLTAPMGRLRGDTHGFVVAFCINTLVFHRRRWYTAFR